MKNFNVNYIVKEEEGIVVCIISDCEYNAIALVDNTTEAFSFPLVEVPNDFYLSSQYKGIAKCVPEDTFDVEYGKKLAYRKAYLKYVTALEKKVKFIVGVYNKIINESLIKFNKAVIKVDGKTTAAIELYNKVLEEAGNETA